MGKSSASRYFSLVCAFILYIICIKFTSIIGYVTIKVIRDSQCRLIYYFEEVFSGVRNTKFAKLYTIIRSLRTTLFVTFLLFCENTWIITKIAVLAVFQILYLAIMIFVQPIEQIKERILNIINEILFFCLAIILIKYNSVSSWTNSAQSGFIWSITATNMLACAIYIIFLIKSIFMRVRKCKKSRTHNYRSHINENIVKYNQDNRGNNGDNSQPDVISALSANNIVERNLVPRIVINDFKEPVNSLINMNKSEEESKEFPCNKEESKGEDLKIEHQRNLSKNEVEDINISDL